MTLPTPFCQMLAAAVAPTWHRRVVGHGDAATSDGAAAGWLRRRECCPALGPPPVGVHLTSADVCSPVHALPHPTNQPPTNMHGQFHLILVPGDIDLTRKEHVFKGSRAWQFDVAQVRGQPACLPASMPASRHVPQLANHARLPAPVPVPRRRQAFTGKLFPAATPEQPLPRVMALLPGVRLRTEKAIHYRRAGKGAGARQHARLPSSSGWLLSAS